MHPIKLYCYIDETGQDTSAQTNKTPFFAVGVVVTAQERHELEKQCEEYEKMSGKGKFKWGKAQQEKRLQYLKLIFNDKRFINSLRIVVFADVNRKFEEATYRAIAYAIQWQKPENYQAHIYIDALAHDKRAPYRKGLHQFGIRTAEIKGIKRDESNALMRLADAIVGATRDVYEENNTELQALFITAQQKGYIVIIEA